MAWVVQNGKQHLMLQFTLAFFLSLAGLQNSPETKEALRVYQTPNLPGSITVRSKIETGLAFFLFDLEGVLVYQTQLKNAGEQTVEGLSAGTYTYHAFQADKRLHDGKVELKNLNQ